MMPASCSRLRLGGNITGSALGGGTSIQSDQMFVITLSGLLGHPGRRGANVQVPYLDGALRRPRKRSQVRQLTLSIEVMDRDIDGTIPTTRGEQWEENMDLFMALVDGQGESVILERDMQDGTTRWIEAEPIAPWVFSDGLRNSSHVSYLGVVPLEAHHPYWQTEQQFTASFGSAFVPPGTATLFNQVHSFASAGVLTHVASGTSITCSAGSFPVLVDCGLRRVTVGGADASNRITLSSPDWIRLPSGATATFTTTATGSTLYRGQFL